MRVQNKKRKLEGYDPRRKLKMVAHYCAGSQMAKPI
ncbi:MAG: hypothetical protein UR69_C0004G0057 [Candidatus Moranbacteria bacterium GW2011_GWE2_35_2-]|nr:MAG: hypothetical protein UR69_C0004G0057 [Candidatus Moranbacteria bacterium GW2011_GWE2_35_2-]KKQ22231.1 MAG: hypothetical protein US37_C0003G0057 [Candidatus Moranbacteria bacterium GW2011_GWF2_37_11]KKQ30277.1 MAG: hypothetical protein US47_C0003G0072 [Candidatus Moranbacteria bacterium GW2011_GWE1_37_24]KKQ46921.1 MAG: hypothetical protein US66_C0024G0004 [Candidatus Moranbacteria bacterium GW2011_GWD2_37_9]